MDIPTYIVAEIGINHNGSLEIAKSLIDVAVKNGVDAVKFQKRTPELCVPPDQQKHMRETPWGYITYLDYRYKVEFGLNEYREIDRYCKQEEYPLVCLGLGRAFGGFPAAVQPHLL